jgi:hypothetical protein
VTAAKTLTREITTVTKVIFEFKFKALKFSLGLDDYGGSLYNLRWQQSDCALNFHSFNCSFSKT